MIVSSRSSTAVILAIDNAFNAVLRAIDYIVNVNKPFISSP